MNNSRYHCSNQLNTEIMKTAIFILGIVLMFGGVTLCVTSSVSGVLMHTYSEATIVATTLIVSLLLGGALIKSSNI